jgi:glucan biosynthesis protein C
MTTETGIAPNIDTVRGLACLLVVALHMVGVSDSNGLHLPDSSAWHYANISIEFLRIPLFTALSGYLYGGRRVTRTEFHSFWTKKFRRLAVPLLFGTAVYWSLRRYAHGEQTPFVVALFFEFGHLWYLQALLLLFTGISIADAFFHPTFAGLVLSGLTAIMISQTGLPIPTFLGLAGALYLAPYFLFGVILRGRPDWLSNPQAGVLALGIVAIVLTSQQLSLQELINPVTILQLPAAVAGMAGVVFLLQRMPQIAWLGGIGRYSYTIYLWHVAAGAGFRDVLMKLGVTSIPVLFLLCLAVAVASPIALFHIARRIPLLSVAVTGNRWIGATRSRTTVELPAS